MPYDIQSRNFKAACLDLYGKNEDFTLALKSAMRNPTATVTYNGKKWSHQKKGIKACCLDRIIHHIRFFFSRAYQSKFRTAVATLHLAVKVYQINPDHSAQVSEINRLEKPRVFHDEAIERLIKKKAGLVEQHDKVKAELEANKNAFQEYCNQSGIQTPARVKNKYLDERNALENAGITEAFLGEYRTVHQQIKETGDKIKDNQVSAKSPIKMDQKKLVLSENVLLHTTLNKLTARQQQLDAEFYQKELPAPFDGMDPISIDNYLWTKQSGLCRGLEHLKTDTQYTGFGRKITGLEASQKKHLEEIAKVDDCLKAAQDRKKKFEKDIQDYIDSVLAPKQT